MAAARTFLVSSLIDNVEYELRDTVNAQYTAVELLVYFNKCYEMIYEILTESNSELVATGSGSITTVAGTETYSLATNSMDDMWTPFKLDNAASTYAIYLTDSSSNIYDPIEMVEYQDRFAYVRAGSGSRNRPTGFYLDNDNFGLLPIADAVYTVTVSKYIPNFIALASTASTPLRHLFNLEIEEGIKLIAKNRESQAINIESVLMELFQTRAMRIMRARRKKTLQLKPRWK